jgi:hypothetical protein
MNEDAIKQEALRMGEEYAQMRFTVDACSLIKQDPPKG